MKTISFLLFCLVAGVSFSQEYPPETARTPASACGDSITKLLHVLVTEADALYEQKKYRQALDRYNSYAEIHQANAHVNTRIRELQKLLLKSHPDYDYHSQLEKIRSFAWKEYQLGNCGNALELYRRLRLLAPGNEEANSCYEELVEKLRPDTASLGVRCAPDPPDSLGIAADTMHFDTRFGFRLTKARPVLEHGESDLLLCVNRDTFLLEGRPRYRRNRWIKAPTVSLTRWKNNCIPLTLIADRDPRESRLSL